MNEIEDKEKKQEKIAKQKWNNKVLLIMAIVATPLFVVANPFSFFIALEYINPFIPEPVWFSERIMKFYGIACIVFAIITILKYMSFAVKRTVIDKGTSFALFYRIHIAAQLPYLFLLKLYQEFKTEASSDGSFATMVLVLFSIVVFLAVFICHNVMSLSFPDEEE